MKKVTMTIPFVDKTIDWNNTEDTYIVGSNGAGKTLLMNEMIKWCKQNDYTFIQYNATSALSEAEYEIDNASDEDIIYAVKMLMDFSYDFKDDVFNWAKHKNSGSVDQIGEFVKDVDLLRSILRMAGAGYTRMFLMFIKAIKNPTADYYFLNKPETSLHMNISEVIVNLLMKKFPYMKFVVSTHSPDVFQGALNSEGEVDDTKVIDLDEAQKAA